MSSNLPELPDEVWAQILPFVKEYPECLVPHATQSAMALSFARQQSVKRGSLTTQLWYHICKPLLFTHIVTENYPFLISKAAQAPFRACLASTKTLRIEYSAKGQDPSYWALLHTGGVIWNRYRMVDPELEEGIDTDDVLVRACEREIKALMAALVEGNKLGGLGKIFPKLESLSISSIYGLENAAWAHYDLSKQMEMMFSRDTNQCGDNFARFVNTGNLRNLCVRSLEAPLNIPAMTFASNSSTPSTYTRVVHFPAPVAHLPSCFGTPIRWVSDAPPTADWAPIITSLLEQVTAIADHRQEIQGARRDVAKIDIYCSTNRFTPCAYKDRISYTEYDIPGFQGPLLGFDPTDEACLFLPEEEQERICRGLSSAVQELFRGRSGLQDIVNWYPSSQTPTCLACGSGVPVLRGEDTRVDYDRG